MTAAADACRTKIAYLTERLATNAAYLLGLRYPDDAPLEAYDCPACPDWHLATLRGGVAVPTCTVPGSAPSSEGAECQVPAS